MALQQNVGYLVAYKLKAEQSRIFTVNV